MKYPVVISATITSGKVISFQIKNEIQMNTFVRALHDKAFFVPPGEAFRALNCAKVCFAAVVE